MLCAQFFVGRSPTVAHLLHKLVKSLLPVKTQKIPVESPTGDLDDIVSCYIHSPTTESVLNSPGDTLSRIPQGMRDILRNPSTIKQNSSKSAPFIPARWVILFGLGNLLLNFCAENHAPEEAKVYHIIPRAMMPTRWMSMMMVSLLLKNFPHDLRIRTSAGPTRILVIPKVISTRYRNNSHRLIGVRQTRQIRQC
jgi:hypothetical protein